MTRLVLCLGGVLAACDTSGSSVATSLVSSDGQTKADGPALTEGSAAPNATLRLQNGKSVEVASLRGRQVVLYFYPRDDTPGCRIEAQGFRDEQDALQQAGVVVYGVSTQDAASHVAFIEKEKLNFDLVVDSDGAVARAFGVPVRAQLAARHTVLIDAQGKIKRVWRSVSPAGHAAEVLAAASL